MIKMYETLSYLILPAFKPMVYHLVPVKLNTWVSHHWVNPDPTEKKKPSSEVKAVQPMDPIVALSLEGIPRESWQKWGLSSKYVYNLAGL